MKTLLLIPILVTGCLFAACRKPGSETEKPPVNTPRPNPIVKPTNEAGVPLTNVPATPPANR